MAHGYSEERQQPRPARQTRSVCLDCGIEWVFSTSEAPGCFKCGSPQVVPVMFNGSYDRLTDPADIAAVMAGVSPDQLQEEAQMRAKLQGGFEITPPPMALVDAAPTWPPRWVTR